MMDLVLLPDERSDGIGFLSSGLGNLPLSRVSLDVRILGLFYRAFLEQTFVNKTQQALEAVYIFPLPPGAAVGDFRMVLGERVIEGRLMERLQAQSRYRAALEGGRTAALSEQERCDVFTVTVGNLTPGAVVKVELEMTGQLALTDGLASFRFPLVVAPRSVPGVPLDGSSGGAGTACDTDAAPDASRITPPVLLQGQPDPVELSLEVKVDPLGLKLGNHQTSLPALQRSSLGDDRLLFTLEPGSSRLDRDFVLAFELDDGQITSACGVVPDQGGQGGTFALTLVPPRAVDRMEVDLVVVLDRSSLMEGWMLAAACRAAQGLIASLERADRFAVVLAGEECRVYPPQRRLAPATERNLFLGLRVLGDLHAEGGLELGPALQVAGELLDDRSRERTVVLITGGQIANETQVLASLERMARIRVHTVGVGAAANHGFLTQLAGRHRGTHGTVDSPGRVDEVVDALVARLWAPRIRELRLEGLELEERSPDRPVDLFPGIPVSLYGRYRGTAPEVVRVVGLVPGKGQAAQIVPVRRVEDPLLAAAWARARVEDLVYAALVRGVPAAAAVEFSLKWKVMSRFVAFVVEDEEAVLPARQALHRVVQPVEMPAGAAPQAEEAPAPVRSMLGLRAGIVSRPALRPKQEESESSMKPLLSMKPAPKKGLLRRDQPAASGPDLFGGAPAQRPAGDLFGGAPAQPSGDDLFGESPRAVGSAAGDLFGGPPILSDEDKLFRALAGLSRQRLWELVQAVGLKTLALALANAEKHLVDELVTTLGDPLGSGLRDALTSPGQAAEVTEARSRIFKWLC